MTDIQPRNSKKALRSPSDTNYQCPICQDVGSVYPLVDGKVNYAMLVDCVCVKAQREASRRNAIMRYCGLPIGADRMTFDLFQTNNTPSLAEAKKLAMTLANGAGSVKWLTLLGKVDRGKTHLAVAICHIWLSRGVAAKYAFVPLLLKELRDGFHQLGEDSYSVKFNALCNIPLLVLDDLGVEKSTDWGREQLQTIIHYRGMSALPLVVTSNKPLDEIMGVETDEARLASQRIASRLRRESWCRIIVMDGAEYNRGQQ